MMARALFRHGPEHLRTVLEGVRTWLEEHEYASVEQLRGSMSQAHVADPVAYARSNYMQMLVSFSSPYDWREIPGSVADLTVTHDGRTALVGRSRPSGPRKAGPTAPLAGLGRIDTRDTRGRSRKGGVDRDPPPLLGRGRHRPTICHEPHPYAHDLPVGPHADRKSQPGGSPGHHVPVAAENECAHLLANEARETLHRVGLNDAEILELAEDFVAEDRGLWDGGLSRAGRCSSTPSAPLSSRADRRGGQHEPRRGVAAPNGRRCPSRSGTPDECSCRRWFPP